MEQKEVEERLAELERTRQSIPDRLFEFLELAGSAYLQYEMGLAEQKRDLVKIITSNRRVDGKKLEFTVTFPFDEVANRFKNANGAPYRGIPRTFDRLLARLVEHFAQNPSP